MSFASAALQSKCCVASCEIKDATIPLSKCEMCFEVLHVGCADYINALWGCATAETGVFCVNCIKIQYEKSGRNTDLFTLPKISASRQEYENLKVHQARTECRKRLIKINYREKKQELIALLEDDDKRRLQEKIRAGLAANQRNLLILQQDDYDINMVAGNVNNKKDEGKQQLIALLEENERRATERKKRNEIDVLCSSLGYDRKRQRTTTLFKIIICPLRLMNIIFSHKYLQRLRTALLFSKRKSWKSLDDTHYAQDTTFWVDILGEFFSSTADYSQIQNVGEEYLELFSNDYWTFEGTITTSEQLRTRWEDAVHRYKIANAKYHKIDQNKESFWSCCKGQLDLLYLHEWLQVRFDVRGYLVDSEDEIAGAVNGGLLNDTIVSLEIFEEEPQDELLATVGKV